MSTPQEDQGGASNVNEPTMLMKLEVVVIPVADVDCALRFYQGLGWRLDADFEAGPKFRAVQLTPPGSACSIHLGRGLTPAAPGTAQGTYLVVSDIDQARADLISRGVEVSEVFHNVYDTGDQERVDGPAPDRRSYASFASFTDPDGNGWLLQEVKERQPGR
ncbi:VOC family protein [Micromonospora phytophila]|uniref:VOC family protein n=1 Tax=Micromonospora phytophila TaxID=709888 RepID=UPI00202F263A|nr:VOC family protein [Micromonospora phytophila]MCM0674027.1 VOC family protein [Micromonospora phytophila]